MGRRLLPSVPRPQGVPAATHRRGGPPLVHLAHQRRVPRQRDRVQRLPNPPRDERLALHEHQRRAPGARRAHPPHAARRRCAAPSAPRARGAREGASTRAGGADGAGPRGGGPRCGPDGPPDPRAALPAQRTRRGLGHGRGHPAPRAVDRPRARVGEAGPGAPHGRGPLRLLLFRGHARPQPPSARRGACGGPRPRAPEADARGDPRGGRVRASPRLKRREEAEAAAPFATRYRRRGPPSDGTNPAAFASPST